jgi:hypothetical protein
VSGGKWVLELYADKDPFFNTPLEILGMERCKIK